jgi:hypothetical protein
MGSGPATPGGLEETNADMDGLRFDNLARTVAAGASRRSVLKGLVAGMSAASLRALQPGAARAQNTVPLGGQCSSLGANSECSQAGGAVVCSDNGVIRDGQFNCCRNAGGSCTADFHCCGAAVCVNGACGGGGGGGGRGLGAECTSTSQCSQAGGSVVCASNGVSGDGARNCCRNSGGACTSDIQCCAQLFCVNGTCGGTSPAPAPSGGLALGAQCTTSSQCTQTGGATVCADNGFDGDGPLNCCRNEGGACSGTNNSADCCGGLYCVNGVCTNNRTGGLALGAACTQTGQCSQATGAVVCASNGIASDGELNCCHNNGGACDRDIVCCGGLLCVNNVCGTAGGTGGTIGLGGRCAATGECNQDGGAAFCADNGIASDGPLNCCRYEGGGCAAGAQCCGGLDCRNGVCSPISGGQGGGNIAVGGRCAADGECTAQGGASFCRSNGLETDGSLNCCRFEGGACSAPGHCCGGLNCVAGVCG